MQQANTACLGEGGVVQLSCTLHLPLCLDRLLCPGIENRCLAALFCPQEYAPPAEQAQTPQCYAGVPNFKAFRRRQTLSTENRVFVPFEITPYCERTSRTDHDIQYVSGYQSRA